MTKLSSAPKGFTGYIKYISCDMSGLQRIIIGKSKSRKSSTDKTFLIENFGVRQLYGIIGRENITTTKIIVFTGTEAWEQNLIVNFDIVE